MLVVVVLQNTSMHLLTQWLFDELKDAFVLAFIFDSFYDISSSGSIDECGFNYSMQITDQLKDTFSLVVIFDSNYASSISNSKDDYALTNSIRISDQLKDNFA